MRPLRASSSTCASASTSGRLLHAATPRRRGAALLPHAGIASPVKDAITAPAGAAPGFAGSWKQQGLSMADTAAEAADELQQWVRKELKRWGVEDSLAARRFLDRLNQAGLNCPVKLGVATILYNLVPQLLLTSFYVLGSIASCHAIGWGIAEGDTHMLLRGASLVIGVLVGLLYFWLRATAAISQTTTMLLSGLRFGGRTEAFLAAVQEMANQSSGSSVDAMARAAARAVRSMQMLGKTAAVLKALSKYRHHTSGTAPAHEASVVGASLGSTSF